MKTVLSVLVLCFVSLSMARCNLLDTLNEDSRPAEEVRLEVHLQDYFGSFVQVIVDQHVVFDREVEGGNFSGPAAVVPLEVTAGSHELVVTINGTVEGRTTFNTEHTQVIGVSYLPDLGDVRFEFYDKQPLYW